MSGVQAQDPWIMFVYSPSEDDHQKVVDLINQHQLPVTLDANECASHSELRVTRGEVLVGADRIITALKTRFAHLISPMPSQTS